jgi:hypothetical protein
LRREKAVAAFSNPMGYGLAPSVYFAFAKHKPIFKDIRFFGNSSVSFSKSAAQSRAFFLPQKGALENRLRNSMFSLVSRPLLRLAAQRAPQENFIQRDKLQRRFTAIHAQT